MRRRGRDRYRPAQARLDARSPFHGITRGASEEWAWTTKSAGEIRDDLIRIRGGVALPTAAIFRPIFMGEL